ncbi:hypothetical protein ACH5RR_015372 [Cinchona calisaya]|uniref:DUF8040 domain-containing protein n=1 Tax=Cinchona calisaya TaxID=153742 RepID=A0ABD2ZTD4_9GENT
MAMNSDDENAMVVGAATSFPATGYAVLEFYKTHEVIPRAHHGNKDKAGENYMDGILYGSRSYSIDQIRMSQDAFFQLLNTLTIKQLLQPTVLMSTQEQLFMFLQIVGHNLRFRGLKGFPTQNISVAISFDLKFTYVLAGWERSTHDSRVLNDAFSRQHGFRVLQDNDPFWKYRTQVDVVLACCILHNHIVGVGLKSNDTFMKEKNPIHDKYINKKIDMYNEMALVVGKDLATGSFPKGFTNVRLEAPITLNDAINNKEEVPMEKDTPTLVTSTSGTKQHRTRSQSNDQIEIISKKFSKVAAALTKLSNN